MTRDRRTQSKRVEVEMTRAELDRLDARVAWHGFRTRAAFLRAIAVGDIDTASMEIAKAIGQLRMEISRGFAGRANLEDPALNDIVRHLDSLFKAALVQIRKGR
jgi:hypothetical protein